MSCKKNTTTVESVRLLKKLSAKHLASSYLSKSQKVGFLKDVIGIPKQAEKETETENTTAATDLSLDEIEPGLPLRTATAGISGNDNLLIYAALAAAGIYILFKN